jgi:hypothetical protein
VIKEANLLQSDLLDELTQEAYELTAIFTATDKTAKNNRNKK